MQSSFSGLDSANEKKVTRRDRFLPKLEVVTKWLRWRPSCRRANPRATGRGRSPIGLSLTGGCTSRSSALGSPMKASRDALYDRCRH